MATAANIPKVAIQAPYPDLMRRRSIMGKLHHEISQFISERSGAFGGEPSMDSHAIDVGPVER